MSNTAKHLLIGLTLMAGLNAGAVNDPALKVYDADVTVNEQAATLGISLDLRMKDFRLGGNSEGIYTPVIISENRQDSLVLSPFAVCGRNRYYWHLRNDDTEMPFYRAGSKETVKIAETVSLQPWMLSNATIEIRQQAATCCSSPRAVAGNSPSGNLLVARISSPSSTVLTDFEFVFAPPVKQEPVRKSVEGKAFVTFVVNKTELNPLYMNNPAELKKITGSIDFVKADPDAVITEVHIRGYASPEGPYDNNVRLAQGRTQTLAKYVGDLYKFEPGIMTTSYDPEDWVGLRSYVADSLDFNLSDRQGLLAVIDGSLDPDAKDAALRKDFPADYQVLLKQIYPWLRHSDYSVKYNIKVYTELSDLMRLYGSDPTKLRAVDFYTIAQQYPVGSNDYISVMRTAIEVYPDEPMLNLNMANIHLMEGDLDAAQSTLINAGRTPESDYLRGVLAAKRGDLKAAEKWFAGAAQAGVANAEAYQRRISDIFNASPVEILVPLTK